MVGAGLIGRSWAMVFARAGWHVRLYDSVAAQLASARDHIESGLAEQQAYGLADDAAAACARIDYVADLEQALKDVDWVQENAPEVLDVKRALYPRIDRATPLQAIIASSTSAIPASRFTEHLAGRARCLVAHPVNPPHLVPVVELCGAPWTDAATIERARDVMTAIGQVPITVKRELDGFILNRLQGALLSEALRLVGEGYVSPDGSRQDGAGRPRAALVVHRPVRDDRAQRAGRRRRLLRALCGVLSFARGESALDCRLGYCERAERDEPARAAGRCEPRAMRGCAGATRACSRCGNTSATNPIPTEDFRSWPIAAKSSSPVP